MHLRQRSPAAHRTSNSPRHPFVTQIIPYPYPQVLFWVHAVVLSCFASRTAAPTLMRHSARSPPWDSHTTRSGSPVPLSPPTTPPPGPVGDPPIVTSNSARHPLLTQIAACATPKLWLSRHGLSLSCLITRTDEAPVTWHMSRATPRDSHTIRLVAGPTLPPPSPT